MKAKLHLEHPLREKKMYEWSKSRDQDSHHAPGHMPKMATVLIYGKNLKRSSIELGDPGPS